MRGRSAGPERADHRLRQGISSPTGEAPARTSIPSDGLKNAHAYLGELVPLATVIDELEPLLRALGDLELLQWTVYESSFAALAAADWDAAERRIREAVDINHRAGPALHDS